MNSRMLKVVPLLLIMAVVVVAGCTSKTSSDVGASMRQDGEQDTQEELRTMDQFIDPELKNLNITTSNPEIKIVRLELEDKRDYKESEDWKVKVLISNEGNNPFYVSDRLLDANDDKIDVREIRSTILKSGDRKWLYINPQNYSHLDLYHMPNFLALSCETVMPEVSPEFKNLNNITVLLGRVQNNAVNSIDVHSVKYVVINEAKGWKSVFLNVSTKEASGSINIDIPNIGSSKASVSAGEITEVEVPLKEHSPEELCNIELRFYSDSSSENVKSASSTEDEGVKYWNPDRPVTEASHSDDVEPASAPKERELHPLYPGLDEELTSTKVDENTIHAYKPDNPENIFIVTSSNGVVVLNPQERQNDQSLLNSAIDKWSFSTLNNGRCELTGIFKHLEEIPGIYVTTPKGVKMFAENFKITKEGDPILSATVNGFNDLDMCILNTNTYKESDTKSVFPWTGSFLKLNKTELSDEEIWKITISGDYL